MSSSPSSCPCGGAVESETVPPPTPRPLSAAVPGQRPPAAAPAPAARPRAAVALPPAPVRGRRPRPPPASGGRPWPAPARGAPAPVTPGPARRPRRACACRPRAAYLILILAKPRRIAASASACLVEPRQPLPTVTARLPDRPFVARPDHLQFRICKSIVFDRRCPGSKQIYEGN